MNRTLHLHQQAAIAMLRQSLSNGHRRPILQAPTGFGKTVVTGAIVHSALTKRKRVIVTVPALSLIEQTVASFEAEGIRDVGVIQGKHERTDLSMPVQIATVQTLQRRKIPRADIVIVDECHRWFDFHAKWMADPEWANVPFIGLSATPWTKGLGKHYDDLLVAATTQDLIDAGFLSPFRVLAPSHPDLKGVATVAGDYHEGQLSAAMNKPKLVADAVETWLARGENRPTLVFAVDRAHAAALQEQFAMARVNTAYIDAHTPVSEREAVGKAFNAGQIKVVVNVGCLTTGIDWDVRCIVLARPTKSEILFTQIVGRGLRTASGKDHCLILDHSDTTLRLGFVTDIHHTTLDGGKHAAAGNKTREKDKPLPKECPRCHTLKPAKVNVCPCCGHETKRVTNVEHVFGELIEVKPGKAKKEDEQLWYSMFLHYAVHKGYATGWVAHSFKKKFGVWPRGMSEIMTTPNDEVSNYIKYLQINRAKSTGGYAHGRV